MEAIELMRQFADILAAGVPGRISAAGIGFVASGSGGRRSPGGPLLPRGSVESELEEASSQ